MEQRTVLVAWPCTGLLAAGAGPLPRHAARARPGRPGLLHAQVSGERDFFANMVVDAVRYLDLATLDLKMIGMKKVRCGAACQEAAAACMHACCTWRAWCMLRMHHMVRGSLPPCASLDHHPTLAHMSLQTRCLPSPGHRRRAARQLHGAGRGVQEDVQLCRL
jgi:hypothetical protein